MQTTATRSGVRRLGMAESRVSPCPRPVVALDHGERGALGASRSPRQGAEQTELLDTAAPGTARGRQTHSSRDRSLTWHAYPYPTPCGRRRFAGPGPPHVVGGARGGSAGRGGARGAIPGTGHFPRGGGAAGADPRIRPLLRAASRAAVAPAPQRDRGHSGRRCPRTVQRYSLGPTKGCPPGTPPAVLALGRDSGPGRCIRRTTQGGAPRSIADEHAGDERLCLSMVSGRGGDWACG